jgi:hypothetical protein
MTTIVIMPGGFHPFHAGHYALYRSAVDAFPDADVYVAATNDTSARPFPFAIKEKLAKLAGVAPNRFVQVKSPFKAEEVTARYNPEQDTLIFVRSDKDRGSPPQPGGVKKDGSPSYLQPWTGKNVEPFAQHAYMAYLPTVEFGPGMTSATQIRSAWPSLNEKRKTALVMSLYPQTQKNSKLAQTVVKLLDAAIGGEQGVAEGSSTNAEVTKRAKAAAQKAGKTFNTDGEYRLWYAITTQANAATRKANKKQGVAENIKVEPVAKSLRIQNPQTQPKQNVYVAPDKKKTPAVVNHIKTKDQPTNEDYIDEKWSDKYKQSINCDRPQGFSQRAHCAGRKK